jgi:hypothetical protein
MAQVAEQPAQVGEALGGVRVIGAEDLLPDGECPLEEGLSRAQVVNYLAERQAAGPRLLLDARERRAGLPFMVERACSAMSSRG